MSRKNNNKQKRLSFLSTFLRALGVAIKDVPESIITPGALSMIFFSADDTRLSVVRAIVEYYGFRLHIRLAPRLPLGKPNEKYKIFNPYMTLSFLREFLSRCGLTYQELAEAIGLTRDAISYWIKKDDMTVSRLYYLAQKTDSDLLITITPQTNFETRRAPKVITTVIMREHSTIHKGLLRLPPEDKNL